MKQQYTIRVTGTVTVVAESPELALEAAIDCDDLRNCDYEIIDSELVEPMPRGDE